MNTEETELTNNTNGDQPTTNEVLPKSYPCPAITDGFVFENADEEEAGVETCSYPNGGKVKRVTLSDGRVAQTRRVKGYQMVEAQTIAGGDVKKALAALISVSTTVDDKPIIMEDVLDLWGNDYTALRSNAEALNF